MRNILPFPIDDETCGAIQLEEVHSPNGKWKAVKIYDACNAGKDRYAYVSVYVIPDNEQFTANSSGPVFSFNDSEPGSNAPRSPNAAKEIKMRWLDEHNLIINYNKQDKLKGKEMNEVAKTRGQEIKNSIEDIKISYE